MRYFILSGNTRNDSGSSKVAAFINQILVAKYSDIACYLLDLSQKALPFWDETQWSLKKDWNKQWTHVSNKLNLADALMAIVPEWHGMAPPQVKNFFQLATDSRIAHKPCLLITVSANAGGAYPMAELRMSAYKNTQVCFIPTHVIVRKINDVLGNSIVSKEDQSIGERIQQALNIWFYYAEAFEAIRKKIGT